MRRRLLRSPRAPRAVEPREHGNVIVVVLIFFLVLTLVAAAILTFVRARGGSAQERLRIATAVERTDAALGIKLSELTRFIDDSISGTFADGTEYAVVVRVHPEGDLFRITAATRAPNEAPYWTETIVEREFPAGHWGFDGAVWAKMEVDLSGSTFIDGNNHDMRRNPVGLGFGPTSAHDKVAVRSIGDVTVSGGGKVRGGGAAMANQGHPGLDGDYTIVDPEQNLAPLSPYPQTADNHFPTTPDQVLSLKEGRMKEIAARRGTYFTSASEYNTWRRALPHDVLPPNSLLYLDFEAPSPGFSFGSSLDWGAALHIVVQHHAQTPIVIVPKGGVDGAEPRAYVDADADGVPDTLPPAADVTGAPVFDGFGWVKTEPDGDSVVKTMHGQFYGVLICDNLSNMNARAEIYGGVASLQEDDNTVQTFCNGKARVVYCSEAIDRAVAQAQLVDVSYRVLSFRTRPSTRDAETATARVGAATTIPDPPEDSVDPQNPAQTLDGWFEPAHAFETPAP